MDREFEPTDAVRRRRAHREIHPSLDADGEEVVLSCTCPIGRDHTFAEWREKGRPGE